MHCTYLWMAGSTNFAPEMAELTVFGQSVPADLPQIPLIHHGIAAELLVFGGGFLCRILVFFSRISDTVCVLRGNILGNQGNPRCEFPGWHVCFV